MALSFFDSVGYKEAVQTIAYRLEAATKREVDVFGDTWYRKHFKWNDIQHTSADFNTILGQLNLAIAASTIDKNSKEPVRSLDGLKEIAQKAFTYAHTYRVEAEDLRKIAIMQKLYSDNAQVKKLILETLWNVTEKAVKGVEARIDNIVLGSLSNGGSYTFTEQDDPYSPFIGHTIDFGMPTENKGTVGAGNEWTDANKATVDVLKEIDQVCRMAVMPIERILLNRKQMNYIRDNAALKTVIFGSDKSGSYLTEAVLNDWAKSQGLPIFEVVEKKIRVQNGDQISVVEPWADGKLLFAPSNDFGTIESMISDKDLLSGDAGVSYSNYGKIEVAKWEQGVKEGTHHTEFTKASVTAIHSIKDIDAMYVLDVLK